MPDKYNNPIIWKKVIISISRPILKTIAVFVSITALLFFFIYFPVLATITMCILGITLLLLYKYDKILEEHNKNG